MDTNQVEIPRSSESDVKKIVDPASGVFVLITVWRNNPSQVVNAIIGLPISC